MTYAGAYINLDRCPGRRAEIEGELARHGLAGRYRRFGAADGNTLALPASRLNHGEIGCFTSHYLLLKEHLALDRHLHVVEDDTVFASCFDQVVSRIIDSGAMDALDILYTDVALPLSNEAYKNFKALYDKIVTRDAAGKLKNAAFQILKPDNLMFLTANAYLVNKRSIGRIHQIFHDELMRGAQLPVDALLREKIMAGKITAGCIFPFITSVRPERVMNSLVRKVPDVTLKFTAATIARYSFFIDASWDECEDMIERLLPPPSQDDRHAAILSQILAFSLMNGEELNEDPALKKAAAGKI